MRKGEGETCPIGELEKGDAQRDDFCLFGTSRLGTD